MGQAYWKEEQKGQERGKERRKSRFVREGGTGRGRQGGSEVFPSAQPQGSGFSNSNSSLSQVLWLNFIPSPRKSMLKS